MISNDDFKRLRTSLALALAMSIAGAAVAAAAFRLLASEQGLNRDAVAKLNDIRGRLARTREDEEEIRRTTARFNQLRERGIIGDERSMEWAELVRRIRHSRKLLDVRYELSPQHPLDPALLPAADARFEFLASTMAFSMQLLHEEDLLNFLADLRAAAPAYVQVRNCRMERISGEPGGKADGLKADCDIDWITIRERRGT